jgi:hypothetical protein
MSRRGMAALGIVVLWAAGVGALIRRTYFQPDVARLAEAALRVTPSALFYTVTQGDRQVGFASSTIDTLTRGIAFTDYLVADVRIDGAPRRIQARTTVETSRTLRLRTFDISIDSGTTSHRVGGRVEGDSVIVYATALQGDSTPADSQRVRIAGPVLMPSVVPLVVVLGEDPRAGASFVLPVFDPRALVARDARIGISAETTFVVNDSAVLDRRTQRWRGVTPDTLKAWRLTSSDEVGISGWVGPQGRLLSMSWLGFRLALHPYEVAYENWRMDQAADGVPSAGPASAILEMTALAANARAPGTMDRLQVRVLGVDTRKFALDGGDQVQRGDTVTITRAVRDSLPSRFFTGVPRPADAEQALDPEPLVESRSRDIREMAARLVGGIHDPRVAAERINQWVYDSLRARPTDGVPDARYVLRTRSGDANEHTQLYLALARAAGITARAASGLAYVNGKFYYHAWPEVYLGRWVPVDPTFGQFPADAAHLRLVTGGLLRQAELAALLGGLRVEVISSRRHP